MYKVIIWGCGLYYNKYINAIRYQELLGNIKIVGLTGRDRLYNCLDGYSFIEMHDIDCFNIDYVIVTSEEHYAEISTEARLLGFREEKIIQAKVYMFENDRDYLRLLGNLKYYLNLELKYVKSAYNELLKREYPVCRLDDVELHFNHYVSMEEVERKWYTRVGRLNWDNLFIMMFTDSKEVLETFDKLKYKKKICFVPFESPLSSAFFMQILKCEEMKTVPFWKVVNQSASGYFHDYDLIQLLSRGEKNIIDFINKKDNVQTCPGLLQHLP